MNDDTPTKMDIKEGADSSAQLPPSPADAVPPVKKKWSNKRAFFAALSAVVLVLLGGYYAWTVVTPKKAAREDDTAQKVSKFYLASDTKSVQFFNPIKTSTMSRAIEAGEKEQFSGRSMYANQFLQVSRDGNTIAYLTDEYDYDSPQPRDGVRGPTGHFLYAIQGGGKAKQVMDAAKVSDWVLRADGSMVYYLARGEDGSSQDFHVVNLASGKDILIEKDIFSDSVGAKETPMQLANDGSVRMYLVYASGIREYRYQDTFVTSQRWTTTECKGCKVALGAPLSPDGKRLVLRGIEQTGEASLNILDLASGKVKQVKRTDKMSEQYTDVYWSPDGSSIVYSVEPYGSDAQRDTSFMNRFEMYNADTNAFTTGFGVPSADSTDSNPIGQSVGVLGWSPDGRYIMFYNGGTVKMYTVASRQVTDTKLEYTPWNDPSLASGWYESWQELKK